MADNVNNNGERGLVPIMHRAYMAPGGKYDRLVIAYGEQCRYADGQHDDNIRAILEHAGYTTFEQVEAAVRGILRARGCFTCGIDKSSVLGMYARQHSARASSFTPSSGISTVDTQSTQDGRIHLTPNSDRPPLLLDYFSPSWPSIVDNSQSAQRVASMDALVDNSQPSSTNYGSGLPSSMLGALSPSEQRMYRGRFRLDAKLDSTYRPSRDVSFPPCSWIWI